MPIFDDSWFTEEAFLVQNDSIRNPKTLQKGFEVSFNCGKKQHLPQNTMDNIDINLQDKWYLYKRLSRKEQIWNEKNAGETILLHLVIFCSHYSK